jgi:hypothetical protein
MFAWLVAGLLAVGCADKANPVIPSTGGPGGVAAGGSSDGGGASDTLAPIDVEQVASDATDGSYADVTDGSASDATPNSCDLLKPDCGTSNKLGCYRDPVSGAGLCQVKGAVTVTGDCVYGDSQPLCAPGLVCIPLFNPYTPGTPGTCYLLCDPANPEPYCGFGSLCTQQMPGYPKSNTIGYCQLG